MPTLAWLQALVDYHESRGFTIGCPVGALAGELAEIDDSARLALAASFDEWRVALRASLDRLRAAGELSTSMDADTLARAQLSLLEGGLLLMKTERDGVTLRAATAVCLALLGPE